MAAVLRRVRSVYVAVRSNAKRAVDGTNVVTKQMRPGVVWCVYFVFSHAVLMHLVEKMWTYVPIVGAPFSHPTSTNQEMRKT